jgi:hypothetical protein
MLQVGNILHTQCADCLHIVTHDMQDLRSNVALDARTWVVWSRVPIGLRK